MHSTESKQPMKIKTIYLNHVGPLQQESIHFEDDWNSEIEAKILFTGTNGCGKSTLLRAIAMLWEATGYWLDHRKLMPQKQVSKAWLQQWGGVAIVVDGVQPFYEQSVGLVFGEMSWVDTLMANNPDIVWMGELVAGTGKPGKPKRTLHLPQEEWLNQWAEERKKMILTHDKIDVPNIIYLDAEERRWVTPKRNLSESVPDQLSQRWLTQYVVTEDWNGQLEASLLALKTTRLHQFHEVVRHLNEFLVGKSIETDVKPGENRLIVKLKNQRGAYHSLDELSAGEHQVLILIYLLSRWMQEGGIVLIDEPDLYLHPSLMEPLLASIEQLVAARHGQLIITSHAVDIWHRYDGRGRRIILDPSQQDQPL